MRSRPLGNSGITVSEIGFGAWGIGGGWGQRDDAAALSAIHAALDAGVTFFDTAMAYGASEELLATVLRACRDQVVIATKIAPADERWPALPRESVRDKFPATYLRACTEASLRRLNTEYLDIQQLHCWADHWLEQQDDWLPTVEALKREGKIRAFGVSANDWDPYNTVRLIQSGLVDTIQVIYNLFEQRPAEQLLPAAQRHGVGIIVRVPFEEGLLTGALRPGHRFADDDWRAQWLTPERLLEAAPRLQALERELDAMYPSLPILALAFVLAHPAVSTVIPGMRSAAHVTVNCAVSELPPLPPKTLQRLHTHAWHHGWAYPWAQV